MKEAHATWGQDYKKCLSLFNNARELFEKARDYPEALVAEYWISFSHHLNKNQEASREILDPLLSAFEKRYYLWLLVRAHYLLSSIEYEKNEHSNAVASGLRAAQIAAGIHDSVGFLSATGALIEYYRYLGNYAKTLTWIQRGLPSLASSRDSFQVIRYYTLGARAFATFGLNDAAISYELESFRLALNTRSDHAKAQNYAFVGAIQGQLKNFDEASKNVQLAFDLAQANASKDDAYRTMMAYSALQMGHILRDAEAFDKAVTWYTESINLYQTFPKFETHLYHAHKGRFLCYLRQQNDQLAHAEISILFDLLNKYRSQISDFDSRYTFFDVEQTVVDAAIDFEYSRMNNEEQAFDYSNSARARSLLDLLKKDAGGVENPDIKFQAVSQPRSLETIKEQLPEQTQVVQYIVLENKLLICVISRNDFQIKMQPTSKKDLNEKLSRWLNIISRPPKDDRDQEQLLAKELYAILVQPVETLLDKGKLLCIIPDGALNYLPFAALVSPVSGKYLFEDHLLMTSPSASVFLSCSENALHKIGQKEENVLSVGNPTFDRDAFPDFDNLPDAGREAVEVGRRYKSSVVLPENRATKAAVKSHIERSDVIHLALHSKVDDEVPLRSQLLLAKTGAISDSVFYAYEIYNLKLSQTRLVVLSSCQSSAGRYYGGEGVSSLARAFISAGVPLVVASLWPVESSATDMLMVSFHSHRTQGRFSTVEALRKAQQEMVHGPAEDLRRPYYWAAFTVSGGYAEF